MRIEFWGDSLTEGIPGVPFIPILRAQYPEYTMINRGVGGDSVVNLLERLNQSEPDEVCDLAFMWIGTNDVFPKVSWTFPVFRFLKRQPSSRDADEFKRCYHQILETLLHRAPKVVALSPWLVGEDSHNRFNQELGQLSLIAERVAEEFDTIEFLDVRQKAIEILDICEVSPYYANSLQQIMIDVIVLKETAQVDEEAEKRCLHLTLDGVHLNSAGAQLIAESCSQFINPGGQSASL